MTAECAAQDESQVVFIPVSLLHHVTCIAMFIVCFNNEQLPKSCLVVNPGLIPFIGNSRELNCMQDFTIRVCLL